MLRTVPTKLHSLLLGTLLLLIAASRIIRLHSLSMGTDEVWAIWQTFGSPTQIGAWTPVDWNPFYFYTLAGWRVLTGYHPLTLHFYSLLIYLIGCACLYRALKYMGGMRVGLLGMLTYAALAYSVYVSTEVRGYGFVLTLFAFVLWMLARYFRKPTLRRAVVLGLSLAAMFYFHLSSVVAFALLALYSLLVYRHRVWRWWLPGVVAAVVSAPVIISKLQLAHDHEVLVGELQTPTLQETLSKVVTLYSGNAPLVWLILLIVAAVLLLIRQRPLRREPFAMFIAVCVTAILMWAVMALYNIRYFWWSLAGAALFIGWGLSYLPRVAVRIMLIALVLMAFLPVPIDEYQRQQPTDTALIGNFEWLQKKIRWGDVLIVDPNADYTSVEGLDYATRVYFPNGLQIVNRPEGYRRIWYISNTSHNDAKLLEAIGRGRIARDYVGPANYLLRLYEAPPDLPGILFENGMRFHGADIIRDDGIELGTHVRHEGETIQLLLWWSVDQAQAVKLPYSVGIYLVDSNGKAISETSDAPVVVDQQRDTSQWTPNAYFLDHRELTLPYPTGTGNYQLEIAVYNNDDLKRVPAPGMNSRNALPLMIIPVKSW